MKANTIIILILVAFCLILIIQNFKVIELNFLFWTISMSRIIFIPMVLIVGFFLGYIFAKSGKKKK